MSIGRRPRLGRLDRQLLEAAVPRPHVPRHFRIVALPVASPPRRAVRVRPSAGRGDGRPPLLLRFARIWPQYELNSSDTSQTRNADQDGRGPLPRPRPAAFHPRQQARVRPGEAAQHPDVEPRRPQVPLGGRRRARDPRRAADAVPLQGRRFVPFHGHEQLRAAAHRRRGARGLGQLPDPGRRSSPSSSTATSRWGSSCRRRST